jgi:hypothetical protein
MKLWTIKRKPYCVSLFKKTFDKVDHAVLVEKLKQHKVDSVLLQSSISTHPMFNSYKCKGNDVWSENYLGVKDLFEIRLQKLWINLPNSLKDCS